MDQVQPQGPRQKTTGSDKPMPGRCAARLRKTNPPRYCKQWPMKGRKRCSRCGGKTPRGPESPHWKDGRHSKYLPKELQQRYRAATNDPELLNLRPEIALTDARIAQLAERAGGHTSKQMLKDILKKLEAFKVAGGKKNIGAAKIALSELEQIVAGGLAEATVWEDLQETLDLRRKLTESVHRIERSAEYSVPVTEVMAAFRSVTALFMALVKDRAIAVQFADGLRDIVGRTQVIDVATASEK